MPRAEAFYSQYRYGVGYQGVESLLTRLAAPAHHTQFGRPLTVYVSDFASANVSLTPEGYLHVTSDPGWVRASRAYFVVGGQARTAAGPTVVPFSTQAAATAFANRTGGTLVQWRALRGRVESSSRASAGIWRERVGNRSSWASQTVDEKQRLQTRPTAAVAGRNGTMLQSAIRAAPPNTTVVVPPGTYHIGNLTISKPVTIHGAGNATRLVGPGSGPVITVTASHTAIENLSISGIGSHRAGNMSNASGWERRERAAYALADSGVRFVNAPDSLVRGVSIRTPANGVTLLDSNRSAVTDTTVVGNIPWKNGYMGVLTFRSRVVVQNSEFNGGRDGVYMHAGHGTVVRNDTMRNLRYGVHEMYTSDTLLAGNRVTHALIGLVIMTRPSGNAVVGNDVTASKSGVVVRGSRSYVANDTLVTDGTGLLVTGSKSDYVGNVFARDGVGARVLNSLPNNRVAGNTFVANHRDVSLGQFGPLYVWPGNYWARAPGVDTDANGVLDQAYWPTAAIGRQTGTVGGTTLARSPAIRTLRALQQSLPGMRREGVVDPRPRSRTTRPRALSRALTRPEPTTIGPRNTTRHV